MRLLLPLLLLAGCTTGSGTLSQDAALDDSTWVELDLADGAVRSIAEPDARALAQARWRSTHMLFRRVDATVTRIENSLPAGGEVEDHATYTSSMAYVAVFELTTAQWHRLGGAGDPDEFLPATGMSPDELLLAIRARSTSHFRLDLPDAGLWTAACAAGSSSLFAWGNGMAAEAAGTYAVHQPATGGGPVGPAKVGSRTANALGFFDLHGNAWEIVRRDWGYTAHGGAWDSPILQCRTLNDVDLPAELGHPSVGARLVLRP